MRVSVEVVGLSRVCVSIKIQDWYLSLRMLEFGKLISSEREILDFFLFEETLEKFTLGESGNVFCESKYINGVPVIVVTNGLDGCFLPLRICHFLELLRSVSRITNEINGKVDRLIVLRQMKNFLVTEASKMKYYCNGCKLNIAESSLHECFWFCLPEITTQTIRKTCQDIINDGDTLINFANMYPGVSGVRNIARSLVQNYFEFIACDVLNNLRAFRW